MRFSDEHGYYDLNEFPGNKNIVVSNNAYVYPWYRNQGHGTRLNLERIKKARDLGYTKIICTVEEGNVYQKKILKKNGWKQVDYIFSHESANAEMWSYNL